MIRSETFVVDVRSIPVTEIVLFVMKYHITFAIAILQISDNLMTIEFMH